MTNIGRYFTLFLIIVMYKLGFSQTQPINFPRTECYDMTLVGFQTDIYAEDFNNDSIIDLISINADPFGQYGVAFFKGKHGGTYEKPKYFSTQGTQPTSVAVEDLNNDNFLDLIITNSGSNTVSILKGLPNDSFYFDTLYSVKKTPISITKGFFNQDTLIDFIVSCKDSNKLAFMPGLGNGRFDTIRYLQISRPSFITSGDLNGDSYTDIVITSETNHTFTIGFGGDTLNGVFLIGSKNTAYYPKSALIGNFDKTDSYDEIVITGTLHGSREGVYIYKIDSSGVVTHTRLLDLLQGWTLASGDLNNDGYLDIIARNRVLLNVGDTTFQSPKTYGVVATDAVVYDVNEDGYNDYITLGSSICVNLGVGDGTLHTKRRNLAPGSNYLVDFNTDNIQDMVFFDKNNILNVGTGLGDGEYLTTYSKPLGVSGLPRILIEDFNADGKKDIVYEDRSIDSLKVFFLDSIVNDTFLEFRTPKGVKNSKLGTSGFMLRGDFNHDSLIDIISTEQGGKNLSLYINTGGTTPFILGGNYQVPGGSINDAIIADINNDTLDDFVSCVSYSGGQGVYILTGKSNGQLNSPVFFQSGNNPISIDNADFNNDGNIDLITSNTNDKSLTVFIGNGTGSFNSQTYNLSPGIPNYLWCGHLNNDNFEDLVVGVSSNSNYIYVYWGDGTGQLTTPVQYFSNPNNTEIVVEDLNQDGFPEICMAGGYSNSNATIFRNNGNKTFISSIYTIGNGEPKAIDFNGDLKKDIVCYDRFNGQDVTYILNKTAIITNINDTFCGSATLHAGLGDSYLWSTGDTTESITIHTSGSFWVLIKNVDDSVSKSLPRNIVIKPMPTVPALIPYSSTQFCKGDSIKLMASRNSSYTYKWAINDTIQPGKTDTVITAKRTGMFQLLVIAPNGCTDTSKLYIHAGDTLKVTINSNKAPSICYGDSVKFTSTVINKNYQYQWKLNTIDIPTADTTFYYTKKTGNYYLVISDSGCKNLSNTISLLIDSLPKADLNVTDTTLFCNGDSLLLSTVSDTSLQYDWYRANIKVNGANKSYYYAKNESSYYAVVSRGLCRRQSNTVVLKKAVKYPVSIKTTDPSTLCIGYSGLIKSDFKNATEFLWYNNNVQINNANDSFYTVSNPGSYSLLVKNSFGCYDTSNLLTFTFAPPPAVSITYTGNTTICQGNSLILNARPVAATKYQWYKNDTILNGQTNSTLSASSSGNYKVKVSLVCDSISLPVLVTVNPIPPKPTITKTGNALISSSATGNQWYINSSKITGATGQIYNPTATGTYFVAVTNQYNCDNTSNGFSFTTGIDRLHENKISLYPNPNKGSFTIVSSVLIKEFEITDGLGRVLESACFPPTGSVGTTVNLPVGIYFIRLYSDYSVAINKLIIE